MAKRKRKIVGSIDLNGNITKVGDPEAMKRQENLAKLRASEKERQVRLGIDPTKYNAFSNLPSFKSANPDTKITADKDGNTVYTYSKDAVEANKKKNEKYVRQYEDENGKGLDFFKKSGALDDGFQAMDVPKIILGTLGDAGLGVVQGIGGLSEGVGDMIAYGIADVADAIGQDDWADGVRERTQRNVISELLSPADTYLEKSSVFARTSDAISQGIGQIATLWGAGTIAGAAGLSAKGVSWISRLLMGASAYGSGRSEAYTEGATDGESAIYGAISAASSVITESMFSGWGKAAKARGIDIGMTELDDVVAKKITDKFTNQIIKNGVQYTIKAGAEGVEGLADGIISALGKKWTYMSDEEIGRLLADENLLEQFVTEAVTSGFAQSGDFIKANKTKTDFITGYDQNEQAVIKREVEKRIAEREKDGTKLTNMEKDAIEAAVSQDMERGAISTDTIEEVLGGETYEAYKKATEDDKKVLEELATLYEGEELKAEIDKFLETSESRQIGRQLSEEVFGKVKDRWLGESYYEGARRTEKFTTDTSKYDAAQREVIQRAIDSGVLNNTRRTHEFVELVAKISADRGVLFDFVNNEKLKGSIYSVDGKQVNGFVTEDGKVVLNVNSAKSLNTVVGHEITHVLEGTELYAPLQDMLFEFAKGKKAKSGKFESEYAERLYNARQLYKNVKGYEGVKGFEKIKMEVAADLVGDYLFTDADFIRNLSTKNRNLAQRIYDEIKYLWNLATAGSKEARDLERIKKAFEDAWRSESTESTGMKHSLSIKHTDGTVEELADARSLTNEQAISYLSDAKAGKLRGETYIPVRKDTPQVIIDTLADAGESVENLSLVMQVRKAQQAMSAENPGNRSKKHGNNVRKHALTPKEVVEIVNKIDDPSMVILQTNRKDKKGNSLPNNVAVFVEYNNDGNEGLAVIEFENPRETDAIGTEFGDTNYHTVVTVFEPDVERDGMPFDYAEELLSNPDNYQLEIKKRRSNESATREKHPNTFNESPFFDANVPQEGSKVKKFSLSEDVPLEQRLSGDALLDAEDLIAEITDVADISPEGYVTVYHRTTTENAKRIMQSGKMSAKEDGIFFSTRKDGEYGNYGDGVVTLRVPIEKFVLDDIFDTEAHLRIPLTNRRETLNVAEYLVAEPKYSLTEQENAYQYNLENGDMDLAEMNVEEYANLALPDSKIRGKDGRLIPVYHGTKEDFWEFDTSKNGGVNGTAEGFGIYLSDDPEVTGVYGDRQIKLFANITHPATSTKKTISARTLAMLIEDTCKREAQRMVDDGEYDNVKDALRDTWVSNYVYTYDMTMEQAYREVAQTFLQQNSSDMDIVQEVMFGMAIRSYDKAMEFYRTSLTPITGFDGFATQWETSGGKKSNIYLAFDSSQLKSADAVTKDDNGNVIPLSERFNPEKKDIRYSLSDDPWLGDTELPFDVGDSRKVNASNYDMDDIALAESFEAELGFSNDAGKYKDFASWVSGEGSGVVAEEILAGWGTEYDSNSEVHKLLDYLEVSVADSDDPDVDVFERLKTIIEYVADGESASILLDEAKMRDSDDAELSYQQAEFFKDSKVRDRDGRLMKVYHTTNNEFTVFDKSKKGENTGDANTYLGFFFAESPDHMSNFPDFKNGKTTAYYLNMKNPIDMTNLTKQAFMDLVELTGGDVTEAAEVFDAELEAEKQRSKRRGDNDTSLTIDGLLYSMVGDYYYADFYDALKPNYDKLVEKGYDGVIGFMDEMTGEREFVVFDSNQAKLTTNTNPTSDPDIRRSLSNIGEEQSVHGTYNVRGEEIAFDDFAPIRDDVEPKTAVETAETAQDVPIREDVEPNAVQTPDVAQPTEAMPEAVPPTKSVQETDGVYVPISEYDLADFDPEHRDFIYKRAERREVLRDIILKMNKGDYSDMPVSDPKLRSDPKFQEAYREDVTTEYLELTYSLQYLFPDRYDYSRAVGFAYGQLSTDNPGYDRYYEAKSYELERQAPASKDIAPTAPVAQSIAPEAEPKAPIPDVAEQPTVSEVSTKSLNPQEAQALNIMASNIVGEARKQGISLDAYYAATADINAFRPTSADALRIADALEPIVKQLGNATYTSYIDAIRGYGGVAPKHTTPMQTAPNTDAPKVDAPRTEADMFPDEQVPESDSEFYDRVNSYTDEDAPPEREVYYDQQADMTPISKKLAEDIRRDVRAKLPVSNRQVATLRAIIDKYAHSEFPSREQLFEELKKNFSTFTESYDNEMVRDAKSYLRTYGVRVDDYIKHEIADYADLVRRNRGRFLFSKKGTDVDVLYHEMNEMFPGLFPESIIAPTDQLLRMIEVANMDSVYEYEHELPDDAIYEVADSIIRRVSEYRQQQTEKQANRHARESFDSLMADADAYVPPIDPNLLHRNRRNPIGAAENSPEIEQYENSQGQQAMRFPRQTPPGTTEAVTPEYEIHDTEHKKGVVEGQQAAWEEPVPEKVTRAVLHERAISRIDEALASEGGLEKVLKDAKNLSTFTTVDNTPQRVFEKAFGRKAGKIISDLTVNAVAQSTTEGVRWLNTITGKEGLLDNLVRQYGIKPGTRESAIAQIYAEGYYIDDAGEVVRYGDAQLLRDVPDVDTRSRIKSLVADPSIRLFYDETLDIINEARVRNGYDPIPRLDNYYLHFRAQTDTFSQIGLPFNPNDIKAKDLPTNLNGVTADLKPGKPFFASEMHRKGLRTTHDLLGGLERYATSAMPQIYYIDHIQTLRALRNHIADIYGQATDLDEVDLSEDDIQAIIQKRNDSHLSTMAKFLNEEANILAGKTALIDRSLEGLFGRRAITFMDTIRKQSGSNQVGLNVSSSLTNFEAVARGIAKSNKLDVIKGFSLLVSNKIKSIFGQGDTFAEDSPVIVRRKGADRFYRTPWEKIRDVGYVPMGIVDDIATELLARTKYSELTRNGMDSQRAHIETDKWVSRLMGDRSLGQMPQLFNSKTMGAILQFQLEVRNTLDSNFYDTVQEANEATEHIENKLQRNAVKAAKITATFVELAIAQHLFGKAFESLAGYNPTFDIIDVLIKTFGWDDDEEDEDTIRDNLSEGFKALLEDLPYSSTLTGGRIPMSAALPITDMINGTDQYGNEKAWWKTGLEALPYYFMPTGYGQIKKTAQGLDMFSEEHPIAGSYTRTDAFEDGYQVGDVLDTMLGTSNKGSNMRFPVEDTLGNRIQAGLFGQYANKNARYYFDNDLAPMTPNQMAEYAEVDIPIREYWDYREGLKGKDTLGEKVAYISNLDLPIWKKNILVNNQSDRKDPIDLADYNDYDGFGEFDYAQKYPDKYAFLEANGISVKEFESFDDDTKEAYNWAYQNPEKFTMSKAVTDDISMYKWYTTSLNDIEADKDADGKTISGSAKKKKIAYINSLNLGYEASIVLFKSEYPADDTYNKDIINYIESRADFTFEDKKTILTELGFTVTDDGRVTWD